MIAAASAVFTKGVRRKLRRKRIAKETYMHVSILCPLANLRVALIRKLTESMIIQKRESDSGEDR